MLDAGYSKSSSENARFMLAGRLGVRIYMEKLNKRSINRFGVNLKEKVMMVFFECLTANKLEKLGIEYPDHQIRREAADHFSKYFGWNGKRKESAGFKQFNFSQTAEGNQIFNREFNEFQKKYYNTDFRHNNSDNIGTTIDS